MPNNKISPEMIAATHLRPVTHTGRRESLLARVTGRLFAGRFDRMLAVGVPAHDGSALAVHAAQITTTAEREALARSLSRALCAARDRTTQVTTLVPVHRANVLAAEPLIDTLRLRLYAPTPVCVRGMARLRLVLSDGCGPMYRHGHGDLSGRLGAALAEL